MTQGGARARSGPPADPNALRRGQKGDAEWTHLPAAGRQGPVPAWPLPEPTRRERAMWGRLWRRPQAVVWEANQQHDELALFVRVCVEAEAHDAPSAVRTLTRQMLDSLGLSVPGLRSHRWVIDPAEPAAAVAPERMHGPDRDSAKARFRVITEAAEEA